MIERWIEAFRGDTRASRGITAAHLAEVAEDDFTANPRGLCFGHPKNDDPAAGQITGAKVDGNRLLVKVSNLADKAVEGIKSGAWLNRSAAFFDPDHEANPRPGKWTLRHVGLLGGAAPGIPGMAPLKQALSFDADGGLVAEGEPAAAWIEELHPTPIIFTAFDSKEPAPMELSPEQIAENDRLKAERDQLDKDRQAFAASQDRAFEAGNTALVDGLVAAGKVLPAEVDQLKNVFNALGREELEFGAADKSDKATPAAKLASFLASAIGKRAPVDGERISPSMKFDAAPSTGDANADAAAITAQANKLVKDEGLTFAAAVAKVSGEA
jgi:hypothetical protein